MGINNLKERRCQLKKTPNFKSESRRGPRVPVVPNKPMSSLTCLAKTGNRSKNSSIARLKTSKKNCSLISSLSTLISVTAFSERKQALKTYRSSSTESQMRSRTLSPQQSTMLSTSKRMKSRLEALSRNEVNYFLKSYDAL